MMPPMRQQLAAAIEWTSALALAASLAQAGCDGRPLARTGVAGTGGASGFAGASGIGGFVVIGVGGSGVGGAGVGGRGAGGSGTGGRGSAAEA